MFLIVNAASANAFLVASSQLFGELPISSMTFTTVIFCSLQYIMCVTIYYFLQYIIETVMRSLLRLFLISLFIRVFSLPLLACPKRVISQFFMPPLMIWGLLFSMSKSIFVC